MSAQNWLQPCRLQIQQQSSTCQTSCPKYPKSIIDRVLDRSYARARTGSHHSRVAVHDTLGHLQPDPQHASEMQSPTPKQQSATTSQATHKRTLHNNGHHKQHAQQHPTTLGSCLCSNTSIGTLPMSCGCHQSRRAAVLGYDSITDAY